MINVLIIGKDSYIGNNIIDYLSDLENYYVEVLDVKNDDWNSFNFKKFNIVIQLAAIVHQKNITNEMYFKINKDLAINIAKIAKKDGVNQFIFFSTMAIYGKTSGTINETTKPNPKTSYAKSKYDAEIEISKLESKKFIISIIRPPLVYGPNCRGNYNMLSKYCKKSLVFPKTNNNRSMIFIDNLVVFVKFIIDNVASGIFHPQNDEYINVSTMAKEIANVNKHNIWISGFVGYIVKCLGFLPIIKKNISSLTYDFSMSNINSHINIKQYNKVKFKESILLSEDIDYDK